MHEMEVDCCHLCLSTERRLSSPEEFLDVYLLLVGLDPRIDWDKSSLRACWECRAMLQRVSTFRKQAKWVRGLLDTAENIILDSDVCLSKLTWEHLFTINLEADNSQQLTEKENAAHRFGSFGPICHTNIDNTNKDQAQDIYIEGTVNANVGLVSFDVKEEKNEPTSEDENQQNDNVNTTDPNYGNVHAGLEILKKYWENSVEKGNVVLPYTEISVSQLAASIKQVGVNTTTASPTQPATTKEMNIEISQDEQKNALKEQAIEIKGNLFASKNKIQLPVRKLRESLSIKSELIGSPVSFENADEMVQELAVPDIETEVNVYSSINTIQISQHEQNSASKIPQGFLIESGLTDSSYSFDDRDEVVHEEVKSAMNLNKRESCKETRYMQVFVNGIKVTESQLKDFLEKARNDKKYLSLRYKCQYCILGFENISSLHKHMDRYQHNVASKGAFVCKICDRRMPTKQDLDNHSTEIHQFLYSCLEGDFFNVCPVIVGQHYVEKHALITHTTAPIIHQQSLNNPEQPLKAQNTRTGSREGEVQVIGQPHEPVKNLNISHSHIVKHKKGHRTSKITKFEVFKPSKQDIEKKKLPFKKAKWSCVPCCLKFSEESMLVKHSKLHSKEAGAHMCDVCTLRFKRERDLMEHRAEHNEWYRCLMDPKCKYVSMKWSKMRRHGYMHCLQESFVPKRTRRYEVFKPTVADMETLRGLLSYLSVENHCELCCDQFTTDQELREHGKLHEKAAGAHGCKMCKLRFTSESLLAEHKRVHEQWYRCKADPGCLHITQTFPHMQKHLIAKHKQERPRITQTYECNICKKVFFKKSLLVNHLQIHDKPRVCDVCGLRFVSNHVLKKHKLNQHTNEEKKYTVCEFCPKRFYNISKLRYHRNMHLNIKPYDCKQCHKMFSNPNNRNSHYKSIHLKTKPKLISLTCSVCRETLPSKWALCKHVQTHRDLRRFMCEKCPKSFLTFNNLIDHQVAHTEEKNPQVHHQKLHIELSHKKTTKNNSAEPSTSIKSSFLVCAECGKQFRSVKILKEHLKSHLIFPD